MTTTSKLKNDISSLPPNAKRVYTGHIYDVYAWPQTLPDGSVVTYEKLVRPDTIQVLAVTKSKEIIILEEEQTGVGKFIGIPSGKLDPGETPLTAAQRELLEETGYGGGDWTLYEKLTPASKIIWSIHTFIARHLQPVSPPHPEPGEIIQVKLGSFTDLLNLADNSKLRNITLLPILIRAKYDPASRQQLKKLLFD